MAAPAREGASRLLATALPAAIDLERHAKQAHWNVRGPTFIALHGLFDRVADEAKDFSDLIAERLAALGGRPDARVATVARESFLDEYPMTSSATSHINALASSLAAFGGHVRKAIDAATELGDAETADVFTEIGRGVTQLLWLVEAHEPVGAEPVTHF